MNKPRNQKQYKDGGESDMERPRNPRNKDRDIFNDSRGPSGQNFVKKGTKTAKQDKRNQKLGPLKNDQVHQKYLMPEMNELINDDFAKQNYFTQDEMGDSRLAQIGGRRRQDGEMDSADERLVRKAQDKHFTPGRIRASKMDSQQRANSKQHNNFISPKNGETMSDAMLSKGKRRAQTRPRVE